MKVLRGAIYGGVAGALATPLAAIAGLARGEGPSLNLLDVLVYVVNWANVALFDKHFYLASARTAAINAAGWSLVGAMVADGVRRASD